MLIGETVALNPVTPDDAQLVADWRSDPAYLGAFFNIAPQTRQMIEPWMINAHGPEKGTYLITEREQQAAVGEIGFWNPFTLEIFKGLEFYWFVHPRHRQRGFATTGGMSVGQPSLRQHASGAVAGVHGRRQ